jgi:NADH-quinone oxidoreductase subunit G
MLSSNSITIAVGNDVLRVPSRLEFLSILVEALRLLGKSVKLFPVFDRANQRGAWEMGLHPGILPGYRFIEGDGMGCEEIIDASSKGEIGALYVAGEDIVSDFPDGGFAGEALRQVKFLVVQDIFLTETARMANVVLPGAGFVEKDGTFTNQEGRVQRLRKFLNPPGDAKADWEIIASIGEAIEFSFHYTSVSDIFEEIKGAVPMYREITFENLDGNGAIVQAGGSHPHTLHPTPCTFKQKPPDPEYPFTLITGNHLYHSGRLSLKADTLRDILSEAIVEMNEEDAKAMGISKGDKVKVKGERYEAILTAHINRRSVRGVVFIPENFTDVPVNMFFTKGKGFPGVKVFPYKP